MGTGGADPRRSRHREARLEALTARLDVAEAPDAAAVATELEAPLPLDCAPMFPDSWFAEFADFPDPPTGRLLQVVPDE